MTSKNLFFKRFKQDAEQRIWLPVILFLIAFLFMEIALVAEFEWLKTRNDYVTKALDYLTNDFFTPYSVIGTLTVIASYLCDQCRRSGSHRRSPADLQAG